MTMHRIHIVGCSSRSGTTLLMELMKNCFDIDLFAEHEDRILNFPTKKCKIFLTKKPGDIIKIEPILRVMKNLSVIYMVRDPRDVIVSKHRKNPDLYWTGLGFWKAYTPIGKKLESHPRFLTIRYEDLTSNPNKVQCFIQEKIPYLKQTRLFEEFNEKISVSKKSIEALNGVRAVSTSRIGNWRNHLPRIKEQIRKHGSISDDLIYYGYEKDENWLNILENVEDVNYESFLSEYPQFRKFKKWRFAYKIFPYLLLIGHNNSILAIKHFLSQFWAVILKN